MDVSLSSAAEEIPLTLQSPTNTLDLRGLRSEAALEATWAFVDRALLRGERGLVVIHGHGGSRLKTLVRASLAEQTKYPLRYRPGHQAEGGDGVTIIAL